MKKTSYTEKLEKHLAKKALKINIRTAKRIVSRILKDNSIKDKENAIDAAFLKANQNSVKFKHKTDNKTFLQIPNAFPVIQCLNYNLKKYEVPEFSIFNDANFDYIVENETDELRLEHETGDEKFTGFTFADFMIMSAFYTWIRNNENTGTVDANNDKQRIYKITLENVFSLLYPGKRWDKTTMQVKNALNAKIYNLNRKLQKANGTYYRFGKKQTEDFRGFLFLRIPKTDYVNQSAIYTVKINLCSLLLIAEKQKRIVGIAPEFLKFPYQNEENNYLAVWYMSYRVNVSKNDKNKMKPAISIKTLDFVCGKVSRPLIKGYFQYLQEKGIIADFHVSRLHITFSFPEPVIIVRNAEKQEIKKALTKDVAEVQTALIKYNTFAGKHSITCEGETVKPDLHAVYSNADWNQGGRLYGKVQELSSEDRQGIRIDGEKTIELDFSSLHPNMLYAGQGIQLQDDPYCFIDNRKLAKKALNIMVNSGNMDESIGAIKKYMQENGIENITAKTVIDNCIKKHSAISKYFFSGAGLKLQNKDAKMALKIITEFQRENIVCLPVHDSFIVPAQYENKLREMMKKVYAEFNNNCDIEIKPNKADLLVKQAVQGIKNVDIFEC